MTTMFKKERASKPPARLGIPLNLRSSTLSLITQRDVEGSWLFYFFLSSVDHSITYSSEGCYVSQWSFLWWQKYQNEFLWSSCLQDFRSSRNWNYLSLKITSNGTVKNVPGPSMLLEVLQIFAPFAWEATYKMLCGGIVWKGQGISGQLKCGNPEYS